MDPGRQLAQLCDGFPGALERLLDEFAGGARLGVPALARELEVEQQGDEPLLRAVVQVAPETPGSPTTPR